MLRETPGSPVLLVERGVGVRADRYALTTPDVCDARPEAAGRPRVVDVHPVWSVIGLRYRRLYELVASDVVSTVGELRVAARISRSSAYDGVAELARLGLIRQAAGRLVMAEVTLDDLAARLGVADDRAARIAAHQEARTRWRQWLAGRRYPRVEPELPDGPLSPEPLWRPLLDAERHEYLAAVLATGPPAFQP